MSKPNKSRTQFAASDGGYTLAANAEQTLFYDLLAECRKLVDLMDYDEEGGLYFWPGAEDVAGKGLKCRCGICTNGARLIAKKFGGFVAGYSIDSDNSRILIAADVGGHDFAVVGPYIVDWWAWEYDHSIEDPVILRSEGIRLGKYLPETDWRVWSETDFTEKPRK